ncbi:MATE family efflux transporter [Pistricoccus aurantiacus]|uniref:MATE family efflux transporter n=1 Tax=Pistricoccus aurantiacus TaxID=1883414 RepID=UPI00363134C2
MGRQLWRQTWPMAIGALALLSFQLVDSAFVARLGTEPLAAQSFTFPLSFLIIGVQVGLGIAIAALISRALGAREQERAGRLGSLVLLIGSVTIGSLVILLWWLQAPIFRLLGADADTLALIRDYWAPQLVAAWLGALLYFGYSLFRAHGNTRLPGKLMVVTSLINLLLDPLLIFGWGEWQGLGLPGAAWASVIAFACGLTIVVFTLRDKNWLAWEGLKQEARQSAKAVLGIAGPAMISQLMPPLAAMLAISVVAGLGQAEVAAWGLVTRLETLSLVVVLAMTMSLPPWLGRCYGSGDWAQIGRLMRLAAKVVVVWQLALGVLMALLAPWVAGGLSGNPEIRDDLALLIRFLLPSYALLGLCMLVVSAGNALGWPLRAMLMSGARLFVFYLPCLWLGAYLGGLEGLAIGAGAGNTLAGLAAWQLYRSVTDKKVAAQANKKATARS